MNGSVPLAAYRAATAALERVAPALLRRRLRNGKEDAARLPERLGHAGKPRPAGALAWLHGASVGEALALLPLVDALLERGFAVLVTTGTVTSSHILAARLPPAAIHQFVPIDGPHAACRFFDHWRPDLVIFTESELWPNLLGEARRRACPIVLVNARMSVRSFARWRRFPRTIGAVLGGFAMVLAQSETDAERFSALGASHAVAVGNLKFDAAPPPASDRTVADLKASIAGRPSWLAASTHPGEEAICFAAHAALRATVPDLLTVLVPRKTDRSAEIEAAAGDAGLRIAVRSRGAVIGPDTDVYLADTMGEIGLFFRAVPIAFMGKSLVGDGGGQNPIEPAKLGAVLLHGPSIGNFTDVYKALQRAGGALTVIDAKSLATTLGQLFGNPDRLDALATAATSVMDEMGGATARTMAAIEPICAAVLGPTGP